MNLRLANCCGSCKHVNKPKKPEEHAAHYTVAKTERWCFKHGIPTMREALCDDYEFESKRGANPAFKRILKQNEKLNKIIEIKKYMQTKNINELYYPSEEKPRYIFFIAQDKIYYRYQGFSNWASVVKFKDANPYKELVEAYESYTTR